MITSEILTGIRIKTRHFFVDLYRSKCEIILDLTPFIRELLFGHDCVVIPDLGGFIVNYIPSHAEKDSDTFYPPSRQVSFNRNLNQNDGLLISKISGSRNISYGDARNLVMDYVTAIRRKLERGERIGFDKIGVFYNNHEGNIQFEPDRSTNYYLDSYGLDTFRFLPLESYDVRKRILRNNKVPEARKVSIQKIAWRAAIIIPILGVLVAVPLRTGLFKTKIDSSTLNPLATEEFEHNKQAVDNVVKDEVPVPAGDETKHAAEQPAAPITVIPSEPGSNAYYVITGSFKTKENATSQVIMLKKEGFEPEIVASSNGFYRVCAINCSDMNTALNKKDSIAKRYPGAWVSKNK